MTGLLVNTLVGEPPAARGDVSIPTARVLVLGVGNVLMGDEGVGVHVLRRLEKTAVPDGVRLHDGGTGGINLLLEFGISLNTLKEASCSSLVVMSTTIRAYATFVVSDRPSLATTLTWISLWKQIQHLLRAVVD